MDEIEILNSLQKQLDLMMLGSRAPVEQDIETLRNALAIVVSILRKQYAVA